MVIARREASARADAQERVKEGRVSPKKAGGGRSNGGQQGAGSGEVEVQQLEADEGQQRHGGGAEECPSKGMPHEATNVPPKYLYIVILAPPP